MILRSDFLAPEARCSENFLLFHNLICLMVGADELELIGVIIGDGHIHKKKKYYFGITGNLVTDRKYFDKLSFLIEKVWCKKARVFEASGGLRLRICSKTIVERLVNEFSLPFNSGKCGKVSIPAQFVTDFESAKHIIRGIVDTDGSVFVSYKKGSPNYPSLEITTVSWTLATQLREILLSNGFRVANLRSYKSKLAKQLAYKVCLYGKKNLAMWIEKIGFSNPLKLEKALASLTLF